MCHLTVVGQSKDDARAILSRLKEKGLKICLRWAAIHPRARRIGSPIRMVFTTPSSWFERPLALGGFSIGVAGFPEIHPRAVDRKSDLRFLKGKSGCRCRATVITQLFFDNR